MSGERRTESANGGATRRPLARLRTWSNLAARAAGSHRREAVWLAIAVALTYWARQLAVPHVLGGFGDDSIYLALGKAIAAGDGYRSIYAAGQPVQLKYPPGLPLVLAALWGLGRSLATVVWLAQTLSVLVSATAAGVVWWIARARLGLHPLVALVCTTGPFLMDPAILYFSLPLSDPYFVLAWAAALAAAYRLRERPSPASGLVLGAIVATATLFRTEGVALIAAFALALVLRRVPWRTTGAYLVSALAPVLAWMWVHARLVAAGPVSTQPDELPYTVWLKVHSLGDAARLAAAAVRYNWLVYWQEFGAYMSEVRVVGVAILAGLLALAVTGGVLVARRHQSLWCTTLATAVLVLVWPWPQDRFVFGFLPFAGMLAGAALQEGVRRASRQGRRLAYAGLALFAAAIGTRQVALRRLAYLPVSAETVLGFPYPGQFLAAGASYVSVVAKWLRDHTTPADRILTDVPAAIYLSSGREAVAASPAQSALGPNLFAHAGRYLAGRILDDSVTVVVLSSVQQPITPDIAALFQRCPGVLRYAGNAIYWLGPTRAYFYRVARRDGCLETVSGE